ncbi:hypothetical protein L2D08_20460 [Domibacillus sp. PGB-M46]|uniref:hypothetical protein n=1 Tax=Domibacillus sp. PGB-M46 TaxID=2910255 RepID=UPI001F56EE04|nr:hypothetical protein [Domibacillus sp. PGB-M46]MCI2256709.1 hypothetical protein [Domibacillus sp. PGB-M46]
MSEKNIKGQLLKVPKRDNLRAQPVKFNDKDPFKYNANKPATTDPVKNKETLIKKEEPKVEEAAKKPEIKTTGIQSIKEETIVPQKKNQGRVPVSAEPPKEPKKRKAVVGKNNSTKTIKVPSLLHTQINMLGKFMDETKTYAILNELVDNYVENRLTERQQKQFYFMSEFVQEDK